VRAPPYSVVRSRTVGIPSGRNLPPPLSMYRRRTGAGSNEPLLRSRINAARFWSSCRPNSSMLTRSTPALPLLRFTARKASCINGRVILPVSEWCLMRSGSTIVFLVVTRRSIRRTFRVGVPWRSLFTASQLSRKRSGHDAWHRLPSLVTHLMVRRRCSSFRWVFLSRPSPLLRKSCRPQVAASGQEHDDPPRERAVSDQPYRLALPPWPRGSRQTTWDFHRSVLSALVSGETAKHLNEPSVITAHPRMRRPIRDRPPGLRTNHGASSLIPGRNAIPPNHPHLAPSPPLVAERRWLHTSPPLAAPCGSPIGPEEFE
jgi:hypothetical protein